LTAEWALQPLEPQDEARAKTLRDGTAETGIKVPIESKKVVKAKTLMAATGRRQTGIGGERDE
jgi:hypothetical protein